VDCVIALLAAGADPNATGITPYVYSPLHWVACTSNVDTGRIIFESGGDLTALDHESRTPAELAAHAGFPLTAEALTTFAIIQQRKRELANTPVPVPGPTPAERSAAIKGIQEKAALAAKERAIWKQNEMLTLGVGTGNHNRSEAPWQYKPADGNAFIKDRRPASP
jgi:ankyrin repeat protein